MRPERPSGIVELQQQLRKELKPHEQYNTGHEIPPAGSTTKAGLTSTSGLPDTTVPCNPWPAGPGVRIVTPTIILGRSSTSSLICMHRRNPGMGIAELWARMQK